MATQESRFRDLITLLGTDFKSTRSMIGSLLSLSTSNKTSLVDAINEVALTGGTGGSGANALGTSSNPVTDRTATRPSGLTKVFWQCPAGPGSTIDNLIPPVNWISGDEWIMTSNF
jgi:hypothetical protein